MKNDLYTKIVLTVVAICLASIAVEHTITSAFAQNQGVVKVIICDPRDPNYCANIGYYDSDRGRLNRLLIAGEFRN